MSQIRVMLRADMPFFDDLALGNFLAGEDIGKLAQLDPAPPRIDFHNWDHKHYNSNVDKDFILYKPANAFGRSSHFMDIVLEQEAANVTLLLFNPRCVYSLEESMIKERLENALGFHKDPETRRRKLTLPAANWLDLSNMPVAIVACEAVGSYNEDDALVKGSNFTYADIAQKNLVVAEEIAKERNIKLFAFKASPSYHVEEDGYEEMELDKPLKERPGRPTFNLTIQKVEENPAVLEKSVTVMSKSMDGTKNEEVEAEAIQKPADKWEKALTNTAKEVEKTVNKFDAMVLSRRNKRVRQLLYEHMRDISARSPLQEKRERERERRRSGIMYAAKRAGKWMASFAFANPTKEIFGPVEREQSHLFDNVVLIDHWLVEAA